jgi:hypothetical protein
MKSKIFLLEKRCDVYVLTKMYAPMGEGSFTDESGHLVKSCVIENYKACIGFEGHVLAQLVEALRYKIEGRGFDSQWCHWNFH